MWLGSMILRDFCLQGLDALEWLVQAFDALDLADEQLFSAIGF